MSNNEDFDQIIQLLKSNSPLAKEAMGKIYPDQIDEFNLYLSNIVLHEESARYRGKVIEMSIYLENILAWFLSYYFAVEEKRELLNSIVFDRMDLNVKLNKVKTIIKVNHSKLWVQYRTKIKKIDKLISFRNDLAHSVLNSTLEGKSNLISKVKQLEDVGNEMIHLDEIEYGYFDNHSWVFHSVTVNEINDYIKNMNESIELIEELGVEIIPNYKRYTIRK